MIRINLLPFREKRKRENVLRQVVIFFVSVTVVGLVLFLVGYNQSSDIERLQGEQKQLNIQLVEYQKILDKITKAEKDKEEIQRMARVILDLNKNRTGAVRMLDEMSIRIISNRIWLTKISQSGGSMTLDGMSMDNKTLSDFMVALEESKYFANVNLAYSQQRKVDKLELKQFVISCTVYFESEGKLKKGPDNAPDKSGKKTKNG
ncbi:MAG: PilN domain-containing protein [Deltaproteobacteria bacterium]|nr:PilN domain-containing protein [Deltaproteobacteria bacterium]